MDPHLPTSSANPSQVYGDGFSEIQESLSSSLDVDNSYQSGSLFGSWDPAYQMAPVEAGFGFGSLDGQGLDAFGISGLHDQSASYGSSYDQGIASYDITGSQDFSHMRNVPIRQPRNQISPTLQIQGQASQVPNHRKVKIRNPSPAPLRGRRIVRPISAPSLSIPGSQMDPMQRWRESPPETEAASLSAIFDALQKTPDSVDNVLASAGSSRTPVSVRSFQSRASSSSSILSNASARSKSSSFKNATPNSSSRVRKRQSDSTRKTETRRFHCTFCTDSFHKRYDWIRHEKTLHLNLDQWICAPYGGTVVSPATGRSHCAYCSILDPTPEHLEEHKHSACHNSTSTHKFGRKDHLIQHLRGFHGLSTLPIIDDWKIEPPLVVSRCGFCDQRLSSWQERTDHLANHFRSGLTMDDWEGHHCFEPSIAALVKNSIPPYLLSFESKSLVPFSATDPRTVDHLSQMFKRHETSLEEAKEEVSSLNAPKFELSATSYARFLTFHLGRFAQDSIAKGIFPTDEMFQNESRKLMYGSPDGWEQTIADNNQWLSEFRQDHIP